MLYSPLLPSRSLKILFFLLATLLSYPVQSAGFEEICRRGMHFVKKSPPFLQHARQSVLPSRFFHKTAGKDFPRTRIFSFVKSEPYRKVWTLLTLGGTGVISFAVADHLNFKKVVFAEGKPITFTDQSSKHGVNLQGSSVATAELDEIRTGMKEIEQRLTGPQIGEPLTILLGKMGTGKSVIYNQLQGVPLVAIKQEDGSFVIDRRDDPNKEDGRIFHGYRAETRYPCMSKGIADCPGFEDNRGAVQDMVNAYSLDTLFKRTQNFKLVLVVSKKMLEDRGEDFVRFIKELGEAFPGQATQIKRGLNLVVTKYKSSEIDEKTFRSKISKILADNKGLRGFTDFQREILEFFADESNRQISFFPSPEVSGPIKIEHQLVKGGTISTRDLRPNIFVSDPTKLYIKDLADLLTADTSKFLSSFQRELKTYTKQLVRSHKGPASALRFSFKSMSDDLTVVSSSSQVSEEQAFRRNVENVTRALTRFDTALSSEFTTLMGLRQFLIQTKPQNLTINLNLNPDGTLTAVSKDLQPLSEGFTVHAVGKTRTLKGHIIGTSDLTQLVDVSTLSIYAENSLLIDSDVRMPGVSMSYASPFWNVIGKRRIELRGKDAEQFVPKALDGQNGKPGLPGYSGGNFYGIVDELYNSQDLTIDVSGGNGGKGQDGGKGIDGENGEDGDEDTVKERKIAALKDKQTIQRSNFVQSIRWPFMANEEHRLTYRSGKPGKKGGTSGAGGIGGFGGEKGGIYFEDSMFTDVSHRYEVNIMAADGEKALDGIAGNPGKGGRHGKVFEGIYIDKPINGWGMLKRTIGNGGVGGLIGAGVGAFGGPIGVTVGFKVGALIGGGGGGAVPALSTIGDQLINSGWEAGPCMHTCDEPLAILLSKGTLKVEEYAPDGEKPKNVNQHGVQRPVDSPSINYDEVRRNWRRSYKNPN